MVTLVAVSGVLAAWIGVTVWTFHRGMEALAGIQAAIREGNAGEIDGLTQDLRDLVTDFVELRAEVDRLPSTWQEMEHKVRRTEERTRGAVRRAMAELEESGLSSPELEGAWNDLRPVDAPGSNGDGVQPVPTGMGTVPQAQPIPPEDAWKAATLAYKYGRR